MATTTHSATRTARLIEDPLCLLAGLGEHLLGGVHPLVGLALCLTRVRQRLAVQSLRLRAGTLQRFPRFLFGRGQPDLRGSVGLLEARLHAVLGMMAKLPRHRLGGRDDVFHACGGLCRFHALIVIGRATSDSTQAAR